MPWLKVLEGETLKRSVPLVQDVTILGRDPACEVVLDDQQVSSRHARIVRTEDGCTIEDLGSKNGTVVGNHELTGPQRLKDGDRIEIGSTRLAFSDSSTMIKSTVAASPAVAGQALRARPEAKLRALLEIVGALVGTIDLDAVLARILEALFGILPQAERGFILLRDEGTDGVVLKSSLERQPETGRPPFSRTIFRHVISQAQAVLCEDAGADPHFGSSPSVRESHIRTFLCVPLWDRTRQPLGVLQVDTRNELGRFDEDDLELLAAVAGPVSVAIDNARLHDIAVKQAALEREARDARAVQFAMIPRRRPSLAGYAFWHYYEPARSVGGDYFDFRPVPHPVASGERSTSTVPWAIAIGDVMGKGMPAALLMARLSSEVGLLLQVEPDPVQVVARLNGSLCEAGIGHLFVTFLLAVLDGDRHELTIVNAGHMPPLIRRAGGSVEEVPLAQAGGVLGLAPGTAYETQRIAIRSGDVVTLYTDGITDAVNRDGQRFGDERLGQALSEAPDGVATTGPAIIDAIRRHVAGHAPFDDMTLICFGRT
jgi:serine phosphatase RsbU (regulator of sigma subunit)